MFYIIVAWDSKYLGDKDQSDKDIRTIPCVLLGQIGMDKRLRGKGLGRTIVQFVVGLSRMVGAKIACRYVVLQTSRDRVKLYEKLGFTTPDTTTRSRLIWMSRKIE